MNYPQSRRKFLQVAAAVPTILYGANGDDARTPQIICEPNCLAQESATGFRSVLNGGMANAAGSAKPGLIILAAASIVTAEQVIALYDKALSGAWIVWEISPVPASERERQQQSRMLRQTFGISLAEAMPEWSRSPGRPGLYVRFCWPRAALTRVFLSAVPVACAESEAIAHYDGVPVAARRRTGKGGIILLGCMLGPNVRAGEREATQITTEILREPALTIRA